MDKLYCMKVFVEIARAGSFTAAAQQLGISKGGVSKSIAALEEMLDARLLNRSSKHVRLTDAGMTVLAGANNLLDSFESLKADVRDSTHDLRGIVRVGAPPSFGTHHMVPLIASFAERNPEIQVALMMDDGSANLIAQGLDLSVRMAPALEDASYVAIPLVRTPQMLVASPGYLRRHGVPKTPADLSKHNCLLHSIKSPTGIWRFKGPDGDAAVRVRGSYFSNSGEPLRNGALQGHGISMHPSYMVADALGSGELDIVLPDYVPRGVDIFAIYSTRHGLPVRVRKFLDHLREWAADPPEWAAPSFRMKKPNLPPDDQREPTPDDSSRKGAALDLGAGVRAPFMTIDRNA